MEGGVYCGGGPVASALSFPESKAVTGTQFLHPTRFLVQVVNLGEESQAHFPEVHRDNVEGLSTLFFLEGRIMTGSGGGRGMRGDVCHSLKKNVER